MRLIETTLAGVVLIEPKVFGDERGHFFECYRQDLFAEMGIRSVFVQDNQSRSRRGVLRGLHYQLGRPQAKLVRALSGEIFDVAVDVRRGSPTFGRWVGARLSEENRRMMYVPEGFAHGFMVLSDAAEIHYKCTDLYAPKEERGLLWSDPTLSVEWPTAEGLELVLSAKDVALPTLDMALPADLPLYGA